MGFGTGVETTCGLMAIGTGVVLTTGFGVETNFCGATDGAASGLTYGVGTSSSLVGIVNIVFYCLVDVESAAGVELTDGIGSLALFWSSVIAASIPYEKISLDYSVYAGM